MSKFWHVFATIGIAAIPALTGVGQHAIANHPLVTTILGTAWTILGNLLQSPFASSK